MGNCFDMFGGFAIFAVVKIHIFNPEHDIALASGSALFTAPRAGRMMRHDLGYLPALWASDGDVVVIDDVSIVEDCPCEISALFADVRFSRMSELSCIDLRDAEVEVWGWDKVVRRELLRANHDFESLVPDDEQLEYIRQISNRRFAAEMLLPRLLEIDNRLVGKAEYISDFSVFMKKMQIGPCLVKSPWSSSGRGVRFLEPPLTEQQAGWCRNVIERQGGIMIEPIYNNVGDFAMEFFSDGCGQVSYLGLSVFSTSDGGYQGNLVADESEKEEHLSKLIDKGLFHSLRNRIIDVLAETVGIRYCGVFGVDMMIVEMPETGEKSIAPCVELNLRRTMGHVALALAKNKKIHVPCMMNIAYSKGKYIFNLIS